MLSPILLKISNPLLLPPEPEEDEAPPLEDVEDEAGLLPLGAEEELELLPEDLSSLPEEPEELEEADSVPLSELSFFFRNLSSPPRWGQYWQLTLPLQ